MQVVHEGVECFDEKELGRHAAECDAVVYERVGLEGDDLQEGGECLDVEPHLDVELRLGVEPGFGVEPGLEVPHGIERRDAASIDRSELLSWREFAVLGGVQPVNLSMCLALRLASKEFAGEIQRLSEAWLVDQAWPVDEVPMGETL